LTPSKFFPDGYGTHVDSNPIPRLRISACFPSPSYVPPPFTWYPLQLGPHPLLGLPHHPKRCLASHLLCSFPTTVPVKTPIRQKTWPLFDPHSPSPPRFPALFLYPLVENATLVFPSPTPTFFFRRGPPPPRTFFLFFSVPDPGVILDRGNCRVPPPVRPFPLCLNCFFFPPALDRGKTLHTTPQQILDLMASLLHVPKKPPYFFHSLFLGFCLGGDKGRRFFFFFFGELFLSLRFLVFVFCIFFDSLGLPPADGCENGFFFARVAYLFIFPPSFGKRV